MVKLMNKTKKELVKIIEKNNKISKKQGKTRETINDIQDNIKRIKKNIKEIKKNIKPDRETNTETDICDHIFVFNGQRERSTCEGNEDIADQCDEYWIEKEYICTRCGDTDIEREY